jgi:hypothetical protein
MAGGYGCQAHVRQDGERTSPLGIFGLRFAFRFARLAPARNSGLPTWPKTKCRVRGLVSQQMTIKLGCFERQCLYVAKDRGGIERLIRIDLSNPALLVDQENFQEMVQNEPAFAGCFSVDGNLLAHVTQDGV